MNDEDTTIGELKRIIEDFNKERDWQKYHNPKDMALSISIESAELLELFQWYNPTNEQVHSNKKLMKEIGSELADILAYMLGLANRLGIDLSSEFYKKVMMNKRRFPKNKSKPKLPKFH
jgi:NTP pyrophosphatase (non-canonical NTP hydrolase)